MSEEEMAMQSGNAQGAVVLLVEDNLVNQKVARKLLERMGCTVLIANNGAEAVAACRERQFVLVLMDLQMPVMDGLQAARAIRAAEGAARHTPIVALTANAMPEHVAQCRSAGMDDFLSKPIDLGRLREVVALHDAAGNARSPAVAGVSAALTAPIDLEHLRKLSDDDAEFTAELVALYMESSASVLDEIRTAQAHADRNAIARAAHKLKGASANVCANAIRDIASRLESGSASMTSEQLDASICGLSTETGRLRDFLRQTELIAAA
jgi:CheY-like chemotaxis protein